MSKTENAPLNMKNISVYIKPGKKKQKVILQKDIEGNVTYVVSVQSLPEAGAANTELIEVISNYFNIPKKNLNIKSGFKSRHKIITIGEI